MADFANVPVLCFGLRTDFQGVLSPVRVRLLKIADKQIELKAVCHCGAKGTVNLRVDAVAEPMGAGTQPLIGGNDGYVPPCRKHFNSAHHEWPVADELASGPPPT